MPYRGSITFKFNIIVAGIYVVFGYFSNKKRECAKYCGNVEITGHSLLFFDGK